MRNEPRFLHSLMPRILRRRDAESGHVMSTLLDVIQDELDGLEASIDCLYDTWFIETCPEEYLPLLAETVGLELDPFMPPLPSHRRWIANITRYRRDKGTLGALRDVLRDASGWEVNVTELADHLAATSSVRHAHVGIEANTDEEFGAGEHTQTVHVGRENTVNPSGDQLRVIDIEFDPRIYTPMMHTQLSNVGAGCYRVHPLGVDTPIYMPMQDGPTRNQHEPLTRDRLAHDIHTALSERNDVGDPGNIDHLSVWIEDSQVPLCCMNVVDMEDWSPPGPVTTALIGQSVRSTDTAGEIILIDKKNRKRTIPLSEPVQDAGHAAQMLQQAIRSGAKQHSQQRCAVEAVNGRLVVVAAGIHAEPPFRFEPNPESPATFNALGFDTTSTSTVIVSHGLDHRSLNSETMQWKLVRGNDVFGLEIPPSETLEQFVHSFTQALSHIGNFCIRLIEGQLLIVPPFSEDWDKPHHLDADANHIDSLAAFGLQPQIALDPERGRLTLHVGRTGTVFADWIMGVDGDFGANPLPRPMQAPPEDDWCARVSLHYSSGQHRPGFYKTLQAAVLAWERCPDRNGTIRIDDNGRYGRRGTPLKINLNGRRLRIEAGPSHTPCIPTRVDAIGDGGHLEIDGVFIEGELRAQDLGGLHLSHSTILKPITAQGVDEFSVHIQKSMCGPIRMPMHDCELTVHDSIVDGRGALAIAPIHGHESHGPRIETIRTTILGSSHVRSIEHAVDSLFAGDLDVHEAPNGRLQHCATPLEQRHTHSPSCITITEDQDDDGDRLPIQFFSREIGQPGYAVSSEIAAPALRSNASNGSEIGVYNYLFNHRRMHLVERTLAEFIPIGWTASIRITQ